MADMVRSSLLEERPYDLGLNFGINARQIHAEPYRRKDTNLPETRLGQGSDVVLGMIEKCDLTKGSTVSMDNFFSTLPHLEKLKEEGKKFSKT